MSEGSECGCVDRSDRYALLFCFGLRASLSASQSISRFLDVSMSLDVILCLMRERRSRLLGVVWVWLHSPTNSQSAGLRRREQRRKESNKGTKEGRKEGTTTTKNKESNERRKDGRTEGSNEATKEGRNKGRRKKGANTATTLFHIP